MARPALFNIVFETLNIFSIFVYIYLAGIQLPGNGIRLLSITQSLG
jgi:hypothetical protein